MKKFITFSFLILFLVPFSRSISASGFALKSVGGIDVDNASYKRLWHTSSNITFLGIAPAGTSVIASIDGKEDTIIVNSDSSWSYTANLDVGDHSVSFSQDTNLLSFILTIGSDVPAGIGMPPKHKIPAVGTTLPTILIFLSGASFFLFGSILKRKAI